MGHFIIEIGCEDLPDWTGEYLKEKFLPVFTSSLKDNRIEFETINFYYTGRRLIFIGKNVSPFQKDIIKEISGPSAEIGIDKDGKYTLPAVKFAESQKVKVNDLKIKEKKGRKVLVAIKKEKGDETYKIIPNVFLESLKKVEIPKSMKWDDEEVKFIRPIRWIFALFDNKIIPLKYGKIKSNKFTYGHRVLSPERIKIEDVKEYPDKLLKNFVIFDQNIREKFIEEKLKKLIGNGYRFNRDILKKVSNMIEYPVLKKGIISRKYSDIPDRVKEVVIIKLKCIPLFLRDGRLHNEFVIVLDGVEKGEIKNNYESVVVNKLEDAKFFIQTDTKRPLSSYLEDLKKIVFHPKWGSIYQRVERLVEIFNGIKDELNLGDKEMKNVIEILHLCKNDLATLMVSEFPELQGVIGRIYAEKEGYPEVIYLSIQQHYLPKFTGDKIPDFKEGCIVSILDRLEALTGFIIEGVEISGSGDPYGLKKMANGIVEIIWKKEVDFPLKNAIKKILSVFNSFSEENFNKIFNFFLQRVDNLLAGENIIPGIRKAVISVEKENFLKLRKKIDALKEFLKTGKGIDLFIPFVRVANILKQAKEKGIDSGDFKEELLVEKCEKELYKFYLREKEKLHNLNKENDYFKFLNALTDWRKPIDDFFDEVLVMDPDENLKKNRLSLLNKINGIFKLFADFSYLSLKEIENAKRI